nr:PREDICTED: uncharacterized protein LOC106706456 [Latimeria chalumnae]|eukprot:XP_014352931.1 PREDICTED: uncharacterized protein LOC106706456 [Latimeria chalumnae]
MDNNLQTSSSFLSMTKNSEEMTEEMSMSVFSATKEEVLSLTWSPLKLVRVQSVETEAVITPQLDPGQLCGQKPRVAAEGIAPCVDPQSPEGKSFSTNYNGPYFFLPQACSLPSVVEAASKNRTTKYVSFQPLAWQSPPVQGFPHQQKSSEAPAFGYVRDLSQVNLFLPQDLLLEGKVHQDSSQSHVGMRSSSAEGLGSKAECHAKGSDSDSTTRPYQSTVWGPPLGDSQPLFPAATATDATQHAAAEGAGQQGANPITTEMPGCQGSSLDGQESPANKTKALQILEDQEPYLSISEVVGETTENLHTMPNTVCLLLPIGDYCILPDPSNSPQPITEHQSGSPKAKTKGRDKQAANQASEEESSCPGWGVAQ